MANSITLDRFSYSYPGSKEFALENVSFSVRRGGICAVLGASQAGKTTLLYALAGVLGSHFATGRAEGRISMGERDFDGLPPKIMFPEVSLVLQESAIQITGFRSTVREEIAFTLQNLAVPEEEQLGRIGDASRILAISHLLERNPRELSGGELHRVAISAILVGQPAILLLDEPARSLDSNSISLLAAALHDLRQRQTTILTDCELELPLQLAEQYVVLDRGKLVFDGSRKEFMNLVDQFQGLLPVREWLEIREEIRSNRAVMDTIPQRIHRFLP